MCRYCDDIAKRFPLTNKGHREAFADYSWAYKTLRERVSDGSFELFAGDCPMDDIERQIELEAHFAMEHYVKCKGCGKIFMIGYCCRGMAVGKTADRLPNLDRVLWGHYGSYFKK